MGLNKMREEIANTFIAALEENTIPWHRPWNLMNRPANFISGTEYNGLNRFWLAYIADEMKYDDNRWCTFKQASEKGYHIKKGEHGTPVEFWSWYDTQEKKKLNYPEYVKLAKELHDSGENWQERIKPISSIYLVFNASQMEGVPPIDKDSLAVNDNLLECRDKLLEAMELEFIEGGDRAFYLPSNDSLHMPLYENFKSEYGYMATFLHECGHATGAEHRLNRNIKNSFGTENYAKEELRAEIASAFTAQALGIGEGEKLDNHAAYIQSWIKTLKDNPNELFAAIKDAEKISDYLIEKGEFLKEKIKELEKEADITITCFYSDCSYLESGKTYSVYEFDNLMRKANDEYNAGAKAAIEFYGSEEAWDAAENDEFYEYKLYTKVMFTVNLADGERIDETIGIGDISGGVIEVFEKDDMYKSEHIDDVLMEQYQKDRLSPNVKSYEYDRWGNQSPYLIPMPDYAKVGDVFKSENGDFLLVTNKGVMSSFSEEKLDLLTIEREKLPNIGKEVKLKHSNSIEHIDIRFDSPFESKMAETNKEITKPKAKKKKSKDREMELSL